MRFELLADSGQPWRRIDSTDDSLRQQALDKYEYTRRMPSPPRRLLHVLFALALAASTIVAYLPVLSAGFVNWDDNGYVSKNGYVLAGLTWKGVKYAFTTGAQGNWHPLTWLSLMVDVSLFGPSAFAAHLVNVAIHLLTGTVLYLWLERTTGAKWRSLFVAAAFLLHPAHVESVAWISERKDVLAALLGVLSLTTWTRFAATGGRGWYAATAGLLALGLLAKPMLVTWPAVLVLVDIWPLGRGAPRDGQTRGQVLSRLAREKLPFMALALLSIVATVIAQHRGGAVHDLSSLAFPVRAANAVVSYAKYLGMLLFPHDLAAFYPVQRAVDHLPLLIAVATLVATSALLLHFRRGRPWLVVGWLFFLGTLLPVIGLVQVGDQALADRYTYLPSLGVFIAIAWTLGEIASRGPAARAITVSASVAALGACVPATRAQVATWHDGVSLWTRVLAVARPSAVADQHLADALIGEGRYAEALVHAERAARKQPNIPITHSTAALALLGLGRTDEALAEFERAVRIDPKGFLVLSEYASALGRAGRFRGARRRFEEAIAIAPEQPEVRGNFARTLMTQGKVLEAIEQLRAAERLDPLSVRVKSALGAALVRADREPEALAALAAAITLDPHFAEPHVTRGVVLGNHGDVDGAASEWQRALALDASQPDAARNLATLAKATGNVAEAVAIAERALAAAERRGEIERVALLRALVSEARQGR